MWQTFENSVAVHAPEAEIVPDRFHISKHHHEGVDKVRREEHRELMKEGDERLKGMRYHFLFNAEKLDEERQEELNALQKQQLRPGRAWSIKDYFRWFWDEPDAIAGREFFDHWYNWAIRSSGADEQGRKDAEEPARQHSVMVPPSHHQLQCRRLQQLHRGDQAQRPWLQVLPELSHSHPLLLRITGPQTGPKLPLNVRKSPKSVS